MSRRLLALATLACAVFGSQAAFGDVPEELLETPMAAAFGAPPTIGSPMLSPDGTRLVFMQQDPLGVSLLRSLNFADATSVQTLLRGQEEGYDIVWCDFANETRLLCDLRQGIPGRGVDYQRYFAVNVDGTELIDMPRGTGCTGRDFQRDTPNIDWVPDDPEHVVFLCNGAGIQLNLYTRRVTELSGAGEIGGFGRRGGFGTGSFATGGFGGDEANAGGGFDDSGGVGAVGAGGGGGGPGGGGGAGGGGRGGRGGGSDSFGRGGDLAQSVRNTGEVRRPQRLLSNGHGLLNMYHGTVDDTDRWFVRDEANGAWNEFEQTDLLQFEDPFQPVGYGSNPDSVFNIARDEDTGAWSLFRRNLSGDYENRLVFAHGAIDIELVDTMGPNDRVVSAAFLQGRSQRAIVDRRVAEVYQFVSELLPEVDIEIVDESWDQNIYLARARAPLRAAEFILINMEAEAVRLIAPEYDHLTGYQLAETRLVQFEGSDGNPITAHLTLPQEVNGPVPAVILPRQRASHEDIADPHYLVQFLAGSGYAVLRVNNRVDDEYGGGWLPERAAIGWNRTADDIRDAANFLVENGFSETGKICGAGKNYGAYSTLMTAIKYPDLYGCIISIAGVTDPRLMAGADVIRDSVSGTGGDLLDAASPVQRAGEINAPILMFHGENDANFNMARNTVTLVNVLERAKKDVQFIEYPYANHEIQRGPDRIDMLVRILGFLDQHIGPSPAAPAPIDETVSEIAN
jgi:dienelactone hydrolase